MKLECPSGIFTDFPPVAGAPFWFYGENVRFRLGKPETIGLRAPLLTSSGSQLQVGLSDTKLADFYADKDTLILGHDSTLTVIDWRSGLLNSIEVGASAGPGGRWWFASDEAAVYAGRSHLASRVHVYNRATQTVAPLPNAPAGCIAGGIIAGIFILAGVEGFLAGSDRRMRVRWSARRTDAANAGGFVGFQDWIPTDINSSGEDELESGEAITGGGISDFGFVVWTDQRMFVFTPRSDTEAFTQTKRGGTRGLLASRTWVEADGRLWWYDQTRTLNMFDGGAPRQLVNTLRRSSVELLDPSALERCYMSNDVEFNEVILHYPDRNGYMRELAYNYAEDAWYPWSLDRVAVNSAHDPMPGIELTSDGKLWVNDVREHLLNGLLLPPPDIPLGFLPSGLPMPPGSEAQIGAPSPFPFFLATNHFVPDPTMQSLRARNVVVSHSTAQVAGQTWEDQFYVGLRSSGTLKLDVDPTYDSQHLAVGQMLASLRAGGKMLQLVLSAPGLRSTMQFGEIDLDADTGGRR